MEKNIWLVPTDKPSILHTWVNNKGLRATLYEQPQIEVPNTAKNIYITNDEHPLKGDYVYSFRGGEHRIEKAIHDELSSWKKIILTTDQDLIKEGIQEIPTDFLEWFVKNPSCEFVNTHIIELCENCGEQHCDNRDCRGYIDIPEYLISFPENTTQQIITYCCGYKINEESLIMQKDQPKQTIEAIALELYPNNAIQRKLFVRGYNYAQTEIEELRREMFTKEEVKILFKQYQKDFPLHRGIQVLESDFTEWFKQQLITKNNG